MRWDYCLLIKTHKCVYYLSILSIDLPPDGRNKGGGCKPIPKCVDCTQLQSWNRHPSTHP